MISKLQTLLLAVVCMPLIACGGDGTGPDGGLVPGTYQASFTVPLSNQTPGGLIGDHEFTFRVGDPEDAESFELLSSRHRSRTFDGEPTEWESGYLSPATDKVIASSTQWRVQWEYRDSNTLRSNVTMIEEGASFRVRFCRGVRAPLENFDGINCEVERLS